ncbi:MAG TPA: hypothetical protein VHB02_11260 [Acidimicrobiales bacterium]|nr:hypothetical protein [Acidimicrobiales bacterium]
MSEQNGTGYRRIAPPVEMTRETVEGTCPACGAEALQRYPVLAENGWYTAVKCQECLVSVSRDRLDHIGELPPLVGSLEDSALY